jgi:hypothetical protein
MMLCTLGSVPCVADISDALKCAEVQSHFAEAILKLDVNIRPFAVMESQREADVPTTMYDLA